MSWSNGRHKNSSDPCKGKIKHQSEDSAKLAAESLERRRKITVNQYYCRKCKAYHIGHSRRKRKRRRVA